MGTGNAAYAEVVGDPSRAAEALGRLFSAGALLHGPRFVGVDLPADAYIAPQAKLAALSAELDARVFWLSFQSTVDAFQWRHWRDGVLVRALVYGVFGAERMWEEATGAPEAWEQEAFFGDPEALRDWREGAASAAEQAEIERIWREGAIIPGRAYPAIDARESARAAASAYALPGWS